MGHEQFSEAELARIKAFCDAQDEELAEIEAQWKVEREARAQRHAAYMAHLRRKIARLSPPSSMVAEDETLTQRDLEIMLWRARESASLTARNHRHRVGCVLGAISGMGAKAGDLLVLGRGYNPVIMLADCEPGEPMDCVSPDGVNQSGRHVLNSWTLQAECVTAPAIVADWRN